MHIVEKKGGVTFAAMRARMRVMPDIIPLKPLIRIFA